MTATRLDITIEQGADYDGSFPLSFDPTGFSAAMQIRLAAGFPYAILTLTTQNGGLILDGPDMTVTPVIPGSVTSAIIAGRYAYDLKLVAPGGKITRAYQGAAYVSAEVTDIPDLPIPALSGILLEDGGYLLLENGGRILLDGGFAPVLPGSLLLEGGGRLLLENGDRLLVEDIIQSGSAILLEGGGYLLNETGGKLNLEA